MRQLVSMMLQQNVQLKQELEELKGQVQFQTTKVVEQVVVNVGEGQPGGPVEPTLQGTTPEHR
jgi:hypothetical protein